MALTSLRILVQLDFPDATFRLWDGAGPYLDANADVWIGATLGDGLDVIESAINGEAYSLALSVSGVEQTIADMAYLDTQNGDVIGSKVQVLIQKCDEYDQPIGSPKVRFTATIDNIIFDDMASADGVTSQVTIECVNRFALRNVPSGSVVSDTNQKLRSSQLNPLAALDRAAERVPLMADKTIVWPRFA